MKTMAAISTLLALLLSTFFPQEAAGGSAVRFEDSGTDGALSLSGAEAPGPQLAFPGAEGFGRFASGGRGGAVIYVTNLNDSGLGSLRAAVNANGPRTVVFAVSGTIFLQSTLRIRNDDLTIAGQTAPGDGITLANYPIDPSGANNVIIRFIRSRLGDNMDLENDAFNIRFSTNVIIDHCSFSWGIDETATAYDNINFTMQWCIISESLRDSVHEKGLHGYGGIWGGRGATFHHNLIAHHDSRNPRLNGARYHGQDDELVDFRNNVIYNWGGNSVLGGEPANATVKSRHNLVNNYYRFGPATNSNVRSRILQPSSLENAFGLFHVDGNHVHGDATITANNWSGGVQGVTSAQIAQLRSLTPFSTPPIAQQTATEAFHHVLQFAGTTHPNRDPVDARIVHEVTTGRHTFAGSRSGRPGLIDSQNDVGGWPLLASLPAPLDSDMDGMPDWWEIEQGLNPFDAEDRNHFADDSGFTNLERYLTWLVADAFPRPQIVAGPPDVAVDTGGPFLLSVTVTGASPLTYQWFKDGNPIEGASAAVFAVASAGPDDAGRYEVKVVNDYGHARAGPAVVTTQTPVTATLFDTAFGEDTLHGTQAVSKTATNWYLMASKLATASSISGDPGSRSLEMALNSPTTSGIAEAVGLFTDQPEHLEAAGDWIEATVRFSARNISTFGIGLYETDGSLPPTGLIQGTLDNTSTDLAQGGTRDWVGYRAAMISGNAAGSSIQTRPPQTATTNRAQALIVPGTSSSYQNGIQVGSLATGPVSLEFSDETDYTARFRIEREGANALRLELALFAGLTATGKPLYRAEATTTETGARPDEVTDRFAALAIGYRTISNAVAPRLWLRGVTITRNLAAGLSPYEVFAALFGLDPQGLGSPWADADGDGVVNALEFLLRGNPLRPGTAVLPYPAGVEDERIELRFVQEVAAREQFAVTVESSGDLEEWAAVVDGFDGVTVAKESLPDGAEQVVVSVPTDTGRRFLRLRIAERIE
jgi:hypothetical protein